MLNNANVTLDTEIDAQFGGVPKHLGQIAKSIDKWEGQVADQLRLTEAEVEQIKMKFHGGLELQA